MSSNEPKATTVDEYISRFPAATQERLQQIRGVIREVAPEAEEIISYAIPAYKMPGKSVREGVFFSAYDKHIGLYPLPKNGSAEFSKKLQPHIFGKGTARFYLDQPLPLDLIKQFVTYSLRP